MAFYQMWLKSILAFTGRKHENVKTDYYSKMNHVPDEIIIYIHDIKNFYS